MKYRPEIDGLRAFAVIPVILFHAGFTFFSGGYLGVDVFFVISGYLITSILLSDLAQDKFSLANFYERRARRILPALFLVVACCLPFAWFWLTPHHLRDFSNSLMAVATFCSNIQFWQESGYFGTASELKPLLHTWSLAVEEQYYIFFPPLLLLLWRLKKRPLNLTLGLLFILSLLVAQWGIYNKPTAAFFLLPARIWELLIGAFCALYFFQKPRDLAPWVKQGLAMLGFLGLCGSILFFDETTPTPSLYTLIPTGATALIILFATQGTFVEKILSFRLFVGIGLISYSAYLWHQPLLVFVRHNLLEETPRVLILGLLLLTFILAFLSWRFIERPFRNRQFLSRKQVFSFSFIGLAIMFSLGFIGHHNDGFWNRAPEKVAKIIEAIDTQNQDRDLVCQRYILNGKKFGCSIGNKENIKGAIIGDSHTYALWGGLDELTARHDIGIISLTGAKCPAVRNVYRINKSKDPCYRYNEMAIPQLLNMPQLDFIILSARWVTNLENDRFDNKEGGIEFGRNKPLGIVENGQELTLPEPERHKRVAEQFTKSLQEFAQSGKKIIVIYPVPEVGWDVPNQILKQYRLTGNIQLSTSYDRYKERNKATIDALDKAGLSPNLIRIYPDHFFCDRFLKGRCVAATQDTAFYFDDDHLSLDGARFITEAIEEKIFPERAK